MKSRVRFDELHRLNGPDYFEPMAISDDGKNRRRELAEFLTDAFLYFFAVFEVHSMHNSMLERAMYEQLLADQVSEAVSKVTGIDAEMSGHIRTLAKEVVETTYKHHKQDIPIKSKESSSADSLSSPYISGGPSVPPADNVAGGSPTPLPPDTDTDYWLSMNRASDIAYSEANTFFNYTDYVDAKERGYTRKTWHTMLDPKVRTTHEEIEGQTIGIDELFYVGDSQMRFPHDWEYSPNPKEVVNCRCAVDYS